MKLPRLREWRELRGMTQVDLAEAAGRSSRSIAGYEAGAEARPNTARRIAEALRVDVMDLARQGNSGWPTAVDNARRFRSAAKERLRLELSAWRSAKDAEEREEERRVHLGEIGRILQEAYDVETELLSHVSDGRNGMGTISPQDPAAAFAPNAYQEEIRAASRLYGELRGMVEGVGLCVYPMKSGESTRVLRHKVELEPVL